MTSIRCHSFGRRLSFTLIGALLISIVAPHGAVFVSPAEADGVVKTVLAFPVEDESADGNLGDAAARVTSQIALVGRSVKSIDLEVFSPGSPMVRRGIADGSLRTADIEGPKDEISAIIIGKAFRVDSVVLVSVQDLALGGDPPSAEISLMGTEYDVDSNIDADTGTVVDQPAGNTFGVSGTGKARRRGDADDDALVRSAARDAARSVLQVLTGGSAIDYEMEGTKRKKRSNKWRWVAIGLIVAGLIAVTAGGNDDTGGPTVDQRLPTRLSARATSDGVRLTWVRPITTDPIFAYQIQRSASGANFVRIDGDKAGPDSVQFTDFNVTAGTAYVYQIRVLYTSGVSSPWATFNQIVAP